jgi:hypothetical protein
MRQFASIGDIAGKLSKAGLSLGWISAELETLKSLGSTRIRLGCDNLQPFSGIILYGRLNRMRARASRSSRERSNLITLLLWQIAAGLSNKDLARAGDLLLRIGGHFLPLRQPAHCARNGEHHWKHRHR